MPYGVTKQRRHKSFSQRHGGAIDLRTRRQNIYRHGARATRALCLASVKAAGLSATHAGKVPTVRLETPRPPPLSPFPYPSSSALRYTGGLSWPSRGAAPDTKHRTRRGNYMSTRSAQIPNKKQTPPGKKKSGSGKASKTQAIPASRNK